MKWNNTKRGSEGGRPIFWVCGWASRNSFFDSNFWLQLFWAVLPILFFFAMTKTSQTQNQHRKWNNIFRKHFPSSESEPKKITWRKMAKSPVKGKAKGEENKNKLSHFWVLFFEFFTIRNINYMWKGIFWVWQKKEFNSFKKSPVSYGNSEASPFLAFPFPMDKVNGNGWRRRWWGTVNECRIIEGMYETNT